MAKTNKITYKVFLFERVKKKLRFFETETYPLQIRLTSGARSVYLKSNLFVQVLHNKYQQDAMHNATNISVNDVISCEEDLIGFILQSRKDDLSLETVRKEYALLSKDILDGLDEQFKKFLVIFFYEENLPAYSMFIKNDGGNHTSEFILENLEKSLQTKVFEKLLQTAVIKAPPYIPFVKFFREAANYQLPLFPVYRWQQEPVLHNFKAFIDNRFPEYKSGNPVSYINAFIINR